MPGRWNVSLALTILLGIVLFPGAASATCGPSWAELPSDTLVSEFHDVDAVDADTAWAVGYRFDDATQPRAVTARWDGTAWSTIPVTVEGESSDLWGVTVVAEDDVWAVGRYQELGTYETFMLIMHWDGGAWTKVAAPDANLGSLIDVDAVTADDIWAVGSEKVSGQTRGMALHWGGATWSKVSTPNPTGTTRGLRSVSARATGDVWAAGASRKDGVNKPLIERWNGSSWSGVTISGLPGKDSDLDGITSVSATRAWAVGNEDNGSDVLILRFGRGAWRTVDPPDTTGRYKALVDVSSVDVSQAWAVGYAGNGPLILRWNGTAWRRTAIPGPADTDLRAVASLPTGTSFMAGMVAFSESFMLQRCS